MFNHPVGGLSEGQATDIIDVVMIFKHAMYRLKFRENMARLPTPRLLMVIVALDMEKAIRVRNYLNKDAVFINDITCVLKARVGF